MADKLAAKKAKFTGMDPFKVNLLMRREKIRTESIFQDKKNANQSVLMKTSRLPTDTRNLLKRAIQERNEMSNSAPKVHLTTKK